MQKTWVRSLGWEDTLEEEMDTYSSILVWEIPWIEESGRLQSIGSHTPWSSVIGPYRLLHAGCLIFPSSVFPGALALNTCFNSSWLQREHSIILAASAWTFHVAFFLKKKKNKPWGFATLHGSTWESSSKIPLLSDSSSLSCGFYPSLLSNCPSGRGRHRT